MASTHFYYNPTAGTGNAQITVSAATENQTTANTYATITFTNGVSSSTVSVTQKFRPRFTQGPTSVSYTGGTLSGFVKSSYDIVFLNVPSWVTISINGAPIAEGQRVPESTLTQIETVVIFTVAPNTGSSRSSTTQDFQFAYYMNDTITNDTTMIGIYQGANEGIAADTNEVVFEWNETNAKTFNIASFTSWTSGIEDD